MISVANLAKSFGDRTLFSGASFQLDAGQRYGLVGANGSGKSTLLNILTGLVEPTDGSVSIPKSARLGFLRQDQSAHGDTSVLGVALQGNPELWRAMVEKEEVLALPESDFDVHRFAELEEIVQLHDGYGAEARAAAILEGLGIPGEVHRDPISTLSGGFRLRVLLAQVLASEPDALLLDEPTNHLDILSIRWLEKFLQGFAGPVLVISHDHRFLDNVVTRILDVDYATVESYPGNYSDFLEQKAAERERREKEISNREREIAHHQKFVDRFRAKASKARQAQSRVRMIEKKASELVSLPGSSRRYPTFRFEQRRPSGREVLRLEGIEKSFGERRVLHGVDLRVERGDRLAIMGPNGIGKSTLLKIAMGELPADAGEVTWGYETHPGYFAQDVERSLGGDGDTAESWLWGFCPGRDRGFVRGQMGLVLFSGDDGKKPLSALSGGEAARLFFARLALERPNVLVLDEPTNHLDLESIEALVEGLRAFDGTLVLVSHDRWFVGRLATRIVEITATEVRDYRGTYEEYVHHTGDDHLDSDAVVLRARRERKREESGGDAATEPQPADKSAGQLEKERREAAKRRRALEARRGELVETIERAEERVAAVDAAFCAPGFYDETSTEEVARLERERDEAQGVAERAMAEWAAIEESLQGG